VIASEGTLEWSPGGLIPTQYIELECGDYDKSAGDILYGNAIEVFPSKPVLPKTKKYR
jgi:hypothetical protein